MALWRFTDSTLVSVMQNQFIDSTLVSVMQNQFTDSTLVSVVQNQSVWKIFKEINLVTIMRYVPVVQTFTQNLCDLLMVPCICKDIYRQYLVDFRAEPLSLEDI